jgi:hypothetical protein
MYESLSLCLSLSLSLWLCVRARYMLHLDLTRVCVDLCDRFCCLGWLCFVLELAT